MPAPDAAPAAAPGHDTETKAWRHLNFFQHQAWLHARVPRLRCDKCGVRTLTALPWARKDSGFTLLFEALVMALVSAMPGRAAAKLVGEHDTRLWRVVHHYVDEARARRPRRRHPRRDRRDRRPPRPRLHQPFVDIDAARVVHVTEGRDAATVAAADMAAHGGEGEHFEEACIDMGTAFIRGVADSLPAAQVTFDKLHTMKIVNDPSTRRAAANRRRRSY